MEEVVGQDTLEDAMRIKENQGNHEAEVSCGGEADLPLHKKRCKKNPGHQKFIPIQDFKMEHLPSCYHDDDVVDYIRAEADLTCRLSVTSTSKDRPEYYPEREVLTPYPFYKFRGKTHMWRRYGSGWVHHIDTFTEEQDKTCQCEECIKPGTHTPKKVWGKVIIFSARHVVFDAEEARHTTCHFCYDTSATDISQCPTLTGLRVDDGGNIKGDHCEITCVTHDLDLLDKLVKLHRHRVDLRSKVWAKYGPNKNNGVRAPMMFVFAEVKPGYCVVISHPHGCSKQVSVGEWTHRQTWPCTHKFVNPVQEADIVMTSYTYNSATCPGSSGAPVIRLMEETKLWWLGCHPHSEGSGDNNNSNKSVVCAEFVSPVTTYMVNLLGQLNLSSAQ